MSSANSHYCVIIPAFNAAKAIGPLIQAVKRQGLSVVVVDDGSHDRTAMIATEQGVPVISHLRNLGKGSALRSGFQYALRLSYDGVITIDSDGQHNPDEIPRLIRVGEREHAGIVLGDRTSDITAMPFLRRWTNRLMSEVVSRLIHQRIPDSQCGLRFIRKEVLGSIHLQATHFELETELLLAASLHHWKTVSVPVRTIYTKETSHINPIPDTWRFFQVVLRFLGQRKT